MYKYAVPTRHCFGTVLGTHSVLAHARMRICVQASTFSALPAPTPARRGTQRSSMLRRVKPRRMALGRRTIRVKRTYPARAAASSTLAPAKSCSTPTRPAPRSPTHSRCAFSVRPRARLCVYSIYVLIVCARGDAFSTDAVNGAGTHAGGGSARVCSHVRDERCQH
jgi:hypothetical protein